MDGDPERLSPTEQLVELEAKLLVELEKVARASEERTSALQRELSREWRANVSALTKGIATIHERIGTLERVAVGADANSRKAMETCSELTLQVQHEIREVGQQVTEHLRAQDEATDMRERMKAEWRQQESIAAKRLAERHAYEERMLSARTPRVVATITVVGAVLTTLTTVLANYVTSRAVHASTDARLDRLTTQVTSVTEAPPAPAPSSPR